MSAELTFLLAMGLWPSVQRKAQAELDAIVGHDRLPTYADIAQMPYLNALYLEILRWNQVVPLGMSSPDHLLIANIRTGVDRRASRYSRR